MVLYAESNDGRQLDLAGVGAALDLVKDELAHLRRHRVGDLGAAVPDVDAPQARGAVEQPVAVGVPDVHTLAADDHVLAVAHGAHVGERVPEA